MELMHNVNIPEGTDLNTLGEALQSPQNNNQSKWTELLRQAKIDPNKALSLPPVCLSVVGADGEEGIIGSLGDFSLVIGKAKSKKTFCISMFLASMAKNGLTQEKIKGELPANKTRVIFFDTEQSEYYVQKVFHRVNKIIGSTSEAFEAYCLRKFTPEERLQIIDSAIQSTPDLGFVAIDGVRDLVTSINDEEEATKIASFILKWTQEKQIHIIAALHQNKGDLNARGHLGTELVNKAQTVLSVSLDPTNKKISVVEAEFCRDREPETFAFSVNDEELPQLIGDWTPPPPQSGGRPKKVSPNEMDSKTHWDILSEIFRGLDQPNGSEIKNCLTTKLKIGTNKAAEYLTYYEKEGWVKKEGKRTSPKSYYILVPEAFTT
uniref:AAA family ATPase n=1 Tax=Algoriphagus sp. TaxID=1872435 RepID=UPI0040481CA5